MESEEQDIEEIEARPSSARRNLTARTNAARQVAVNFMPSRQLPYNTIRLRRSNSEHGALLEEAVDTPDAVEKHADIIVREMEQHKHLMEDNLEAEGLRREALRDLPQGLTMKRNVRAKLSVSVSLRSQRKPISFFKRLKYKISFAWQRGKGRLRDLVFSVELWYEAIRNIEGHYGSAVGSYFYFLRWLFALNLALAVGAAALLVVPQALHDAAAAAPAPGANTTGATGAGGWGLWALLGGRTALEDSVLFYGHYHWGDVSASPLLPYDMSLAYFFTMACLYLVSFAVLCYRTVYSYRRHFIETAGGLSQVFANKVFCGWDYGISSAHAAELNATSIYHEFKELLYEQNKRRERSPLCTRVGQCATNVLLTAAVLALVGGAQWALWRLLAWRGGAGAGAGVGGELAVSLAVTALVSLGPALFNLIAKCEFYTHRTALYVTLARTWLLHAGTLVMLLVYWARSGAECWETALGQETYRLMLLEAIVSLFLMPIVEFTRGLIFKYKKDSTPPEFHIAYNSLTLIYNQTLLWFGMLFSPLLVVIVTIKFLLLFYVKSECALRACSPARKVWRAAQTQTFFYVLVTLSLFVALFAFGSLFVSGSSTSCGPFVQYESVYEVVWAGALRLPRDSRTRAALRFLTRPGVIAFLALLLCVVVYHMRARALAQRSMVGILRGMLVLQARDKEFLLTAIAKVSNGEWLYSPRASEDLGHDSHTFKYLKDVRKPSNSNFHFDASRLNHSLADGRGRPRSGALDSAPDTFRLERSQSHEDGDTDSSFSWQGSSSCLNRAGDASGKKWT